MLQVKKTLDTFFFLVFNENSQKHCSNCSFLLFWFFEVFSILNWINPIQAKSPYFMCYDKKKWKQEKAKLPNQSEFAPSTVQSRCWTDRRTYLIKKVQKVWAFFVKIEHVETSLNMSTIVKDDKSFPIHPPDQSIAQWVEIYFEGAFCFWNYN